MIATTWLQISVTTDGEAAEAVAELLQPYAYGGSVAFEQLGAAADPNPEALEPEVTVKIFVPGEDDSPVLRQRIEEALYHLNRLHPLGSAHFSHLADTDWASAWKEHFRPFRVGRTLWIRPSWVEAPAETGTVALVLDPGMAFGTGLHPSTQMCLEAVEEMVTPETRMLDIGTGSGILAIAAARLGAEGVVAFDNDFTAARTAAQNAHLNGVGDRLAVFQGLLACVARRPWSLVVVNILADVIVALIRDHGLLEYVSQDGALILSGIIDEQREMVAAAVTAAGAEVSLYRQVTDWVCLRVSKAKTP